MLMMRFVFMSCRRFEKSREASFFCAYIKNKGGVQT